MNSVATIAKLVDNALTSFKSYFNNKAYEDRVKTGLVKTGDKLATYTDMLLKNNKDGRIRKYARHYIKKWRNDRDNLT